MYTFSRPKITNMMRLDTRGDCSPAWVVSGRWWMGHDVHPGATPRHSHSVSRWSFLSSVEVHKILQFNKIAYKCRGSVKSTLISLANKMVSFPWKFTTIQGVCSCFPLSYQFKLQFQIDWTRSWSKLQNVDSNISFFRQFPYNTLQPTELFNLILMIFSAFLF